MGCVTSNSWLDFGGYRDHDADIGIFKKIFFFIAEKGQFNEFCGVYSLQMPVV